MIRFGLDFGTTNTVLARLRLGEDAPVPVRFAGGAEVVPSLVALDEGKLRFGADAAACEDVVAGLKNLLRDHKGRSRPVVKFAGGTLPLDEVLGQWFTWLRDAAREDLAARGLTLPERPPLVPTVPQNCHDLQRRAVREAAESAGFTVLDILNEPTSAALSLAVLGVTVAVEPGRHIAVYDFGGGTFDASLVRADGDGRFTEVDSEGVRRLGGGDVDAALTDLLVARFAALDAVRKAKWDPEPAQLGRLRRQAEKAKIALATEVDLDSHAVTLSNVIGTRSAVAALRKQQVEIERADLAAVADPLIAKSVAALRKLLVRNRPALDTLSAVVLTGGSAGLPGVAAQVEALLAKLGGSTAKVITSDRRMHDVAFGAAWYAGRLAEARQVLERRTALHFGVWRVEHGREWFHVVQRRGDPVPGPSRTVVYRPAHDLGEFRFVQCSEIVDAAGSPVAPADLVDADARRDLRPAGDILDYPHPLRVAFAPALADREAAVLDGMAISEADPGVTVVETYHFPADGTVGISIAVDQRSRAMSLDFARTRG
jgi:molecular chaperone DnaK (HSP70)